MRVSGKHVGKILKINTVPQSIPCQNCKTCLRIRLMEMGLTDGEFLQINGHSHGLWRVTILDESKHTVFSLALRDEEMDRILFEDDCFVDIYQ